ncbi:hypothetical protein [Antiquaquibacter oligotrophicus]|uniref:hypothetical protein n=1 Tax=Antiquaquibacter oligotrophicus TaxID=2880260 RepID=UPI002AC99C32|nr:hypothetical protein [Antiquaquibacter oligotrophicus]
MPTVQPPAPPGAGYAAPAVAPVETYSPPPAPKKRSRIGWIITVVLLALALIATGVFLYLALQRLEQANDRIDDQDREIQEQQDLIEKKETFGAAAEELMDTAALFDGLPYATIVDTTNLTGLIRAGWAHRWNPELLDADTENLVAAKDELAARHSAAQAEASSNASGTVYESLTDSLGTGYLRTSLDTADATCEQDVWGCVSGADPWAIHYDNAQTASEPYMTDWLRTGLAYHEYAHVLQFTNPEQTASAVASFGDDYETMADCYALTTLPGWTLDHTIYTGAFEYWEVSVGYGYTCDANQQQVIRDWVSGLGYRYAPISQ